MADNNNPIVFTFRSFPEELLSQYLSDVDVTVLGKLKQDIGKLLTRSEGVDHISIIGFAISNTTKQEALSINKFNSGVIDRGGPETIRLEIFHDLHVPASYNPTWSFCNYAAYTIARKHTVHFIHSTRDDFPLVAEYVRRKLFKFD